MPGRDGEASLETLQAKVEFIGETVKNHDRILNGNGREGLVQTVGRLEGLVTSLAGTVKEAADSSRRLEIAAKILEQQSRNVERNVSIVQKRVGQVEKVLGPIVNWKRGIYIRIVTVMATSSVLLGAIWWVLENKQKISEMLK